MKKSPWRLALSAVLLACWIGYLAYLSATTTHPIVLSRPQFLSADLYVIAEVPAESSRCRGGGQLGDGQEGSLVIQGRG